MNKLRKTKLHPDLFIEFTYSFKSTDARIPAIIQFKRRYLDNKYRIQNDSISWKDNCIFISRLVRAYDWKKNKPTDEFYLILAEEKI
jgi:hypothetical protein